MTWGLDFQDYDSDPLHDLDGVLGRLVELLGVDGKEAMTGMTLAVTREGVRFTRDTDGDVALTAPMSAKDAASAINEALETNRELLAKRQEAERLALPRSATQTMVHLANSKITAELRGLIRNVQFQSGYETGMEFTASIFDAGIAAIRDDPSFKPAPLVGYGSSHQVTVSSDRYDMLATLGIKGSRTTAMRHVMEAGMRRIISEGSPHVHASYRDEISKRLGFNANQRKRTKLRG